MNDQPNQSISCEETFGVRFNGLVPAFSEKSEHVPDLDPNYHFEPVATRAILAGFAHNRRVLVQGYHGTGKSTHIEQVAARLNWPCFRVSLDGNISRIDLIGRDMIKLMEGKQITEFQEGILPWALRRPLALVFDEYDAGRPEVMFVIQRMLEAEGKLTLLEQNRVIEPHPFFRVFATANTVGLGDSTGLYHGTRRLNQGQMDRWNIVAVLSFLDPEHELNVVTSKVQGLKRKQGTVRSMIAMAGLTRNAFQAGDLSTIMSPRTVISWAENAEIFGDVHVAFIHTFLNKCEDIERTIIAEFYQRCFNADILNLKSPDLEPMPSKPRSEVGAPSYGDR